jgi:quercetin dioxygenase-like cupin family protein
MTNTSSDTNLPIPPDDPNRHSTIATSEGGTAPHIGLVGDTYTILLSGSDTAGRYCLVDMHIPPGGGPPHHRHDFEESFTILEGEIQATFRGVKSTVRAGQVINIPANAPHQFKNESDQPARALCFCSPAGAEELFIALGIPVPTRTTAPPPLDAVQQAEFRKKSAALAAKYRTEFL